MSRISGIFDAVPYSSPKRSTFNGSHDIKTACAIGKVFPLSTIPVYSGDDFNIQFNKDVKFSPLVAPIFQKMLLKEWSFYVRNSDLWDNFDKFYTGVDPKAGRTAYDFDQTSPAHPYFKYTSLSSFGTAHLGIRFNFSVSQEDLESIQINGRSTMNDITVPQSLLKKIITQMRGLGKDCFSVVFSNDDVNHFLCRAFRLKPDGIIEGFAGSNIVENGASTDLNLNFSFQSGTGTPLISPDFVFGLSKVKCPKPLFGPSTICDYLGYPVIDLKSQFLEDSFADSLADSYNFIQKLESKTAEQIVFSRMYEDFLQENPQFVVELNNLDLENVEDVRNFPVNVGAYVNFISSSDGVSFFDLYSSADGSGVLNDGQEKFIELLLRTLVYMKLNGIYSTTDSVDFPCHAILPISWFAKPSEIEVDSLRFRGYWKIWNDYFRDPNLTAEYPIPYASDGDDFANFQSSIFDYLSSHSYFDWTGQDISDKLSPDHIYPRLSKIYSQAYVNTLSYLGFSTFFYFLYSLTEVFNHVRQRDYITGCLPDSSVVEVVAPIMSKEDLAMRDLLHGGSAMTNAYKDSDGVPLPDNTLLPIPNSDTSAVGWLDIENLKITQTLKRYFTQLRHTMQGIKDYVKVFFDVNIDDLTLHRAEFLGGNEKLINISQMSSQSETDVAPLGMLGGRASLYSNGGRFHKFVKENGFIITLNCLSPIVQNVGGVDRQLIRKSRFDYFNPMFGELGDMAVLRQEVSCMPMSLAGDTDEYEQVFGYTQRYMDLKYMPNRVHADFLGAMSDWHLDLMQPAIATNLPVLSQKFLEEETTDRIFAEVNDDENNCFLWVEADVVYSRCLPAIVRNVIA